MRDTNIGGFLGQTFELLGANIRPVLLYILVIGGASVLGLLGGLIDPEDRIIGMGLDMGLAVDSGTQALAGLYQFGVSVLTVIASYFLIQEVLKSMGRLREGGTRIWAYIGMSILSVLGMIVGFILLVIPGIIIMIRWSAASGFLVGAREGVTESLSASWEATRGHSWAIFFAGLVLLIGFAILSGVLAGGAFATGVEILFLTISGTVDAFSNALFITFGIAVYALVHDDSEHTAEVFS